MKNEKKTRTPRLKKARSLKECCMPLKQTNQVVKWIIEYDKWWQREKLIKKAYKKEQRQVIVVNCYKIMKHASCQKSKRRGKMLIKEAQIKK